ncbi:XdhC family protein [Desertivirga brevis]|uniref:XdhC family protein n=1 Tax=Desertivirga brevis TaxID=2810310 RepID=UPI001A968CBC|nr:XdhC/CoxI family protein [Pedobacter sp. SYSU D00873]
MREFGEIVRAFNQARLENKLTALATVVKVEGSAYRRPGARMLVTEDGLLTGAISGGCLEGDALKKALLVMHQKKAMLVKYDTSDDDDAKLGVGLGCNGIIHILIEPINSDLENPITCLEQCLQSREHTVFVTLFKEEERNHSQTGSCLFFLKDKVIQLAEVPENIKEDIIADSKNALYTQQSQINNYSLSNSPGSLTALIEVIPPAVVLNIIGAGNDVIPLVKMSTLLGWEVDVIDGRTNLLTKERFPKATRLITSKSDQVLSHLKVDQHTVFALLSHNYIYDLNVLKSILPLNIPYIGILGPKKKLNRILQELEDEGFEYTADDLAKLYGPAGLDLGAETSEEIALSIVAEIKAVLSKKKGTFLRDKQGPIHDIGSTAHSKEKIMLPYQSCEKI